MKTILQSQYAMICDARNILLLYCETIQPDHFVQEQPGFGKGGSMRNLLVHIGNTYEGWLARRVLARNINFTPYESLSSVTACRTFFAGIDLLVEEFLTIFEDDYYRTLAPLVINDQTITFTPLKVFMHVITHEFHHKGQILSISRLLGYTPVDTDVLR